jgi:hypothetical protein
MTDPTPPETNRDEAPEENEVMRETRRAKEQAEKAEASERKKQIGWKTGVGIGVGSAALLAALLYANRKK